MMPVTPILAWAGRHVACTVLLMEESAVRRLFIGLMHPMRGILCATLALLLISPAWGQSSDAPAAAWSMQTLSYRASDGRAVSLTLALSAGVPAPASVVLVAGSADQPNIVAGKLNSFSPWVRAAGLLAQRGIEVVYMDAASDANGRSTIQRSQELARDLHQAAGYLHERFAGVPLAYGSYGNAGQPLLDFLKSESGTPQAIVVSGDFQKARTTNWSALSGRVTLVAVPSAKCPAMPFYEQQWVASQQHLRLIQANYPEPEKTIGCGKGRQASLTGLEVPFADLVADLLAGRPVADFIGSPTAQVAWREQVMRYAIPGEDIHLEMTLLLPDGAGPFPVMIFSHGDVEMDSSSIRYKQRLRDMTVAAEFLRNGVAVAFPARRGVGMSEGLYQQSWSQADGDALYAARRHAADVLPAIEMLRTLPQLDGSRMIIAGQSAGGYTTMYLASLNLPGVIGAINFSGGRTDRGGFGSSALIPTMIRGFEESGKTTRTPMLWIFAEQDSRYPVTTIQACHEAFTAAGGRATLVIVPYNGHDGHFIYHYPATWRASLDTYLGQIGLPAPTATPG